jgi:hypothetical protein
MDHYKPHYLLSALSEKTAVGRYGEKIGLS